MKVKEFLINNAAAGDILMDVMEDKVVFSDKENTFHMSVRLTEQEQVSSFLADLKESILSFDPAAEAEHKLEDASGILAEAERLESSACVFKQDVSCVYGTLRRAYEKSLLTEEEWDRLRQYRSKHWTGEIRTVYGSIEDFMLSKEMILEDAVKALVLDRSYCVICDRILEFGPRE